MAENLNKKVKNATKWSALTEIIAKLIAPIANMVLARLLAPEAFGIITTLHMVIAFAEIFTDAGFQKYIVQHEFRDKKDQDESTNVAFWSNFVMSLIFWGIIALFSNPLATLVGNPGLGYVLIIACVSIPLASFSSIQMATYRRSLDFKTLFKVKIVGVLMPLLVTIPLAFYFRNFWALLLGNIAREVVNAIILTYYSSWKPRFYYSFVKLKEMLSFTLWSMVEAISIWLTGYVDVFIVGTMLSQHYLGLYKTSTTTVALFMSLITAATTPILFSSLSRLQNDDDEFKRLLFKFQKMVGLFVIPLGFGIFCFSDLITIFFLGDQWMEASGFIGLWGLTSAITIILSHYSSEVYRAKGKPKLSVLAQFLHIVVLWPTVYISVNYGFETLYTARALVRLELILVNIILMYYIMKISPWQMISNILPSTIASICMVIIFSILPQTTNYSYQVLYSILCFVVYILVISMFKTERDILLNIRGIFRKKQI